MRRQGTSGFGAKPPGEPLGCLPYDFELPNYCILPVRGRDKNIVTYRDVTLHLFNGV